ncbi:MAG: methyltransferase [Bacteroidaceae bacterium]|nr:methyltransferase [Bacteroidaceae bacterium]
MKIIPMATDKDHQCFHFKKFSVSHQGCAMKVGTDGVLLGLLAPKGGHRILDVGTGSGLVALLLAQRNDEALIDGVEIDASAACQARHNFEASPWAVRLRSIHQDIVHFAKEEGHQRMYDVIVCNPPFYAHSPSTASAERDMARLGVSLTAEELMSSVGLLLSDGGTFTVIIPSDQATDYERMAWTEGLHLCESVSICTKAGKPCKRMVLTFARRAIVGANSLQLTLMNPDGSRTSEFSALVSNFYLR